MYVILSFCYANYCARRKLVHEWNDTNTQAAVRNNSNRSIRKIAITKLQRRKAPTMMQIGNGRAAHQVGWNDTNTQAAVRMNDLSKKGSMPRICNMKCFLSTLFYTSKILLVL